MENIKNHNKVSNPLDQSTFAVWKLLSFFKWLGLKIGYSKIHWSSTMFPLKGTTFEGSHFQTRRITLLLIVRQCQTSHIYIPFIFHLYPTYCLFIPSNLMDELLIPIESEGDRRSPTAKVDLWEPVSRDEFVHLLRDFKLGEEGPRDQLGH